MALEKTLGGPVNLTDPLTADPPKPHPKCGVCAALYEQWRHAAAPSSTAYDPSKASDIAVEMKRHHDNSGAVKVQS
ncbi:hypothetical protein ACWEQ1_02010 [Streptomyces nodosus]